MRIGQLQEINIETSLLTIKPLKTIASRMKSSQEGKGVENSSAQVTVYINVTPVEAVEMIWHPQ
jgi:hypothetical protein